MEKIKAVVSLHRDDPLLTAEIAKRLTEKYGFEVATISTRMPMILGDVEADKLAAIREEPEVKRAEREIRYYTLD